MRKYRRGGHIISLDELARQEFVYWNDKIEPKGWFLSWQFRMAYMNIGEKGCIYYAIKNEEDPKSVTLRKKAQWIKLVYRYSFWWECSECGRKESVRDYLDDICPCCGAAMVNAKKERKD